MAVRRLVGIDLGIASAHTVRVLDETGNTIAKRKAVPTVESLSEIETAALGDAPRGTRLEVVMEPTGRRGCRSRCSSRTGAMSCTECRQRRRRISASSCRGTPRPTASTPTPSPGWR